MTTTLEVKAKEYIPSWATKSANPAHPPPPSSQPSSQPAPVRNSGFTTTTTSTNAVWVHSKATEGYAFHPPPPAPLATAAPPSRSPVATLRFPTRMSPVHAPFPPVASNMNPNAKDFIPHLPSFTASALTSLPTSTAEIAEEKQRQQQEEQEKKQSLSPASAKWTTTSTKTNTVHPANSLTFKSGVASAPAPNLSEKSEEEILEISRRSALKVGAAAFVPRRTLHRISINKPSPLALTPASAEMALGDLWCLFHLPLNVGESIKESTYDPTLVFHIDNVATFWKVFNNIPLPREMDYGTLYFFRDGINPKWEDPGNRDGGIVRIKVEPKFINDAWILLLSRTIGESWNKTVRNTVNGVVLKVRERAYLLEIWVTRQSDALNVDISDLLQPLLGIFSMQYAPHTVVQERAAAAAAAQAEKEKKNRVNRRRQW